MYEVASTVSFGSAIASINELGLRREPFLVVIDFELHRPFVLPIAELHRYDIELEINGRSYTGAPFAAPAATGRFEPYPMSFEAYRHGFDLVHQHFVLGNTYLTNLTFPTPIDTDLSLREIYASGKARYKLRVGDQFVVYSPESFVRIEADTICSYPMKGTIDASVPEAEATILADEKEMAEHITIVDLIRNDIGRVANRVRVRRFRYIDRVETNRKTLLQVSSEITGELASGWHGRIGSILEEMLPAGSISGAPKRKTVEIIEEAEIDRRGYYTGIFGVFDGERFESGVMIRFVERRQDGRLVYRSGGGLTIYSDPRSEYQELIDKVYVPTHRDDSSVSRDLPQSRTA